MRSADSIKTKIARVMASYKEANERLLNTGSGIQGLAYTTFQELIVNTVCKYYYQLDPILKNRPNVYAWHTNDKARKNRMVETNGTTHDRNVQSILLSSDEEDISSIDNNMINKGVIEIGHDEYDKQSSFETNNTMTNTGTTANTITNELSSSFQLSSDDNRQRSCDDQHQNIQSCDDIDSTTQEQTTTATTRKRFTPSEAKENRGQCLRKGRSLL